MTDRSPLIQQAFQDDALAPVERDRLWTTMQHRSTRQARWRYLVIAGLLAVGAVVAALVFARDAIRSTLLSDRRASGPVLVAADSTSSELTVEHTMIQEPAREGVPANLIPLLGHRSALRMDLMNFNARREELEARLNQTAGREHDRIATELASLEKQIHSTQMAIEVIDRQLGEHHAPMPVLPPVEAITVEPPQVFQFGSPMSGDFLAITGGIGAILVLSMVAVVGYIRRLSRTLKETLAQIEGQVSSQHATLASGIDAIAVEVERLGEGQRFMSKVISGERSEMKA